MNEVLAGYEGCDAGTATAEVSRCRGVEVSR
jgi:hypothetical protein